MDKAIAKSIFSPTSFLLVMALLLTTLLTGCVSKDYENDTPVVQNQANRDEMAATRISLGLGYLKMGNMAQAKLNLEKAKKFSPGLVQVHTAFAHYYEVVGENELTTKSYEKALSIKADDADTLNNYGVFLCRQDKVAAAEVQFLKAIAVPSYVLVAQSYENLASCYLQMDNFSKAEQYLRKAVAHSPNRTTTLSQMVRLQYAMGQYEQAKVYQQKFERNTRRFTPDSLALAYKVYRKLGQRRTAKNYGTMLVKMYPQSWESKQYILNELEQIEADNLAKRYQLTQRSFANESLSTGNKSKKRIVKLSPKSKAKASATASLAAISKAETATTTANSNKVVETSANMTEAITQQKRADSTKTSDEIATQVQAKTITAPKVNSVVANSNNSLVATSSGVNAAIISSAIVDKSLSSDGSEKTMTQKNILDKSSGNNLDKDVNVDSNRIEEKLSDDTVKVNNAADSTAASTANNTAAHSEINDALTSSTLVSTELTDAQVKETRTEVDNFTGTLTHVSTEPETQLLQERLPEAVEGEPTSTMPIPATRDIPLPEAITFVDTDKPAPETVAIEEETLLQDNVKTDEAEVVVVQDNKQSVEENLAGITEADSSDNLENITNPTLNEVTEKELKNALPISNKEALENTEAIYHQVSSGETLYAISVKYNVKIKALRKWNKITAKHKLQINEKLYVVNPETVTNIND